MTSVVKYHGSEKLLQEQIEKHPLNDYLILGILGGSTYVFVFHVVQKATRAEFALKVIEYSEESVGEEAKRLAAKGLAKTEIAMKFNKSKFICPVYRSWFRECGNKIYVYILMNMYHEGSLTRYLQYVTKPIDEKRILKWILQISCGLEEIHQDKLFHRNIKPSNLLIQGGNIRISDFSIATRQVDPTSIGVEICYIAPEDGNPHAQLSPATDMWSLGAILYKLLTLQTPLYSSAPSIDELLSTVPKLYSKKTILLLRNLLQFETANRLTSSEVKTNVMSCLLETRLSALGSMLGEKVLIDDKTIHRHPFFESSIPPQLQEEKEKLLLAQPALDEKHVPPSRSTQGNSDHQNHHHHHHHPKKQAPSSHESEEKPANVPSRRRSLETEKTVDSPFHSQHEDEKPFQNQCLFERNHSYSHVWQKPRNYEISGIFDHTPWYVACKDNLVVVTESYRTHILKYDKQQMVIGHKGSGKGAFNKALGVAIRDDRFYVCDYLNRRIQCFSLETGQFLSDFRVDGKPGSISIANDTIYITTWAPHRVYAYSPQGQLLKSSSCMSSPFGLTAFQDKLFVCEGSHKREYESHQIEVFSLDTLRATNFFGSRGRGPKNFDAPYDILIRENRFCYISDNWNNRIQIWNVDGEYISSWCKKGTAVGEVYSPIGIATSDRHDDYNLYVVDGGNKRIQVFK